MPHLLLEIGERLGCEIARRNLAHDWTAGGLWCGMHYPDLLAAWLARK